MNRLRHVTLCVLSLLICSSAMAQRATIFQLPGGAYIGIATLPTGQTLVLTDITLVKVQDPTPPPPITSGPVGTVVIRTVDTLTADHAQVLSDLRQWTDQQPSAKVVHWEFTPGAVGPDGELDKTVAAFVAHIPANSKQPYVFITQPRGDKKSVILWQGELPASADTIIAKIKEFVR